MIWKKFELWLKAKHFELEKITNGFSAAVLKYMK